MTHRLFPRRTFSATRACTIAVALGGSAHLQAESPAPLQERADRFLALANAGYQSLITLRESTDWDVSVDVTPEHEAAAETASKAFSAFVGNPALIAEARELLTRRGELAPNSVRQLERLLLAAAEAPMTNPALANERIEAETRQDAALNSYTFTFRGAPITPNDIDQRLLTSTDLAERRELWEASKAIGPTLKPGLVRLRELRNGVARELGYADFLSLQYAVYGVDAAELVRLNDEFLRALRPLYLQLHTWTKYELAKRYGQPVPKRIPAHWLANRYGQEWPGLVAAADIDAAIARQPREWIVQTAERFYTSLGFAPLPASFWQISDFYPLPADATRKKSTHAFCYHIDLAQDVRALMNVTPDGNWFGTAHHEFGHAFYMLAYSRPEVPPLLRDAPNSGFHEGIAELGGTACFQAPYLRRLGLVDAATDPIAFLLSDALNPTLPFMAFAAGTMTHWEADFYAGNLSADQLNARWWQYVRDFQGIEPPTARGEELCDAATKTHINSVPGYYANYAIATVIRFQLLDHIAKNILHQPPQSCDLSGHPEVGAFLRRILEKGATEDWQTLLRETTGEELSTRAMVEYFTPLQRWLEEQNRGREIGWE
ncbi:MAG TPA: M2 family metallopeptidase [Opitutaceae bacterium]|nr:M2 family metallopeptidase [Opitutaceae bacterium]